MRGSLLVVEDDPALLESLSSTLAALGLSIGRATSGEGALAEIREREYDVVLLDLNMPGIGGIAACRAIRQNTPNVSILVLTVRDTEHDIVTALEAGADDYVTKPFRLAELIARIQAALRRSGRVPKEKKKVIRAGNITLDAVSHSVMKNDVQIHVTPTEFDLLYALMAEAGKPIAHRTLLTTVWGPDYGDEREYLRTYINQLRKKIEDDPSHPTLLLTDNYIGYRFADSATSWQDGNEILKG